MVIEERSIAVAACDACGHKDYANEQGEFLGGDGYSITIIMHRNNTDHEAYACRETHIGKAARAALDRYREWYGGDLGTLVPPPPEHNGDATAVTP